MMKNFLQNTYSRLTTSVYAGIWLFGESGFTGSSKLGKNYRVSESITFWRFPQWVPLLRYKSYGLVHHSPYPKRYNPKRLAKIFQNFYVYISYHAQNDARIIGKQTRILAPARVNDVAVAEANAFTMVQVRTSGGLYVGQLSDAQWVLRCGVDPKTIISSEGLGHNHMMAGYVPSKNKWRSLCGRATYEFGVGHEVSEGHCAYDPKKGPWVVATMDEARQLAVDFSEAVS